MRNCGSLLEPIDSASSRVRSGSAWHSVRTTLPSVAAMSTLSLL